MKKHVLLIGLMLISFNNTNAQLLGKLSKAKSQADQVSKAVDKGSEITKKGKKGTWKYNEEKHLIELFMENKLIGNIKSITTERILFLPFLDEDDPFHSDPRLLLNRPLHKG